MTEFYHRVVQNPCKLVVITHPIVGLIDLIIPSLPFLLQFITSLPSVSWLPKYGLMHNFFLILSHDKLSLLKCIRTGKNSSLSLRPVRVMPYLLPIPVNRYSVC